ncbi:TPA: hypothetical protein SOK46_000972 [Clostridioides difficile]|nr:hypothetical protein [Clostridioides difficile]HEK4595653.1 hypothetical protein [Clostridioides difficile]HEK4610937.1 hypothetical protein [Clostridioides difficile]HEK4614528.1 hypothetical protein [Clostridioides difficile]HEK4645486.1 hypothetical protein [Clostridioides difficile]
MKISNKHIEWINKLNNEVVTIVEKLEVSYKIIQQILDENEDKIKEDGIFNEHTQVAKLINKLQLQVGYKLSSREYILITRYIEIAYIVYILYFENSMKNLVLKNLKQWFSGKDFNGTSHFRNFEFECSVALRFIEEDIDIQGIDEEHMPDYLIENKFAVECKRTSMFFGVLKNTIKAVKQANNLKKPTIAIINLDYIYNEIEGINDTINDIELLRICSKISEYGLGINKSYLMGVVLEFVDSSDKSWGSKVIAIKNTNTEVSYIEDMWEKMSLAICGDDTLLFCEESIDINNRFDESKTISTEKFYNDIIVADILGTIFKNNNRGKVITNYIKMKE